MAARIKQPPPAIYNALTAAAFHTGVPYEILEAVAWAESAFNPRAKSPAGALGLMQLMPMNIRAHKVTDPFDPVQSAMTGAYMLANLYRQYKDWPRSFAAYNWGPGNLRKKPNPAHWPTETRKYVTKLCKRLAIAAPDFGSGEKVKG